MRGEEACADMIEAHKVRSLRALPFFFSRMRLCVITRRPFAVAGMLAIGGIQGVTLQQGCVVVSLVAASLGFEGPGAGVCRLLLPMSSP